MFQFLTNSYDARTMRLITCRKQIYCVSSTLTDLHYLPEFVSKETAISSFTCPSCISSKRTATIATIDRCIVLLGWLGLWALHSTHAATFLMISSEWVNSVWVTEELVVVFQINLHVLEAAACPSAGDEVHRCLVSFVRLLKDVKLIWFLHQLATSRLRRPWVKVLLHFFFPCLGFFEIWTLPLRIISPLLHLVTPSVSS